MGIKNTVEYLYLSKMLHWEKTAPPDGHQGLLDNAPARNTQKARMAFILRLIGVGQEQRVYPLLSRHSRRDDGNSYVSENPSWMKEPCTLTKGWFFEGCTSLIQKQGILQHLTKLGLSLTLVDCIDEFVAGKSIINRDVSEEEAGEILRRSIKMEKHRENAEDDFNSFVD